MKRRSGVTDETDRRAKSRMGGVVEPAIEKLTALVFLLTGLSHVLQPKAWARFFIDIRERGEVGGLWNAYIHAPLGILIVAFHNVWTWPSAVVTVIGWALLVKGAIYFCWPQLARRAMAGISEERAGMYRIAGVFTLLVAAATGWIAFT
jgi:uncharacterized protein YjeT (DUF2065 family)